MKKQASSSVGAVKSGGSVGASGSVRFVQQRKVPVGSAGQAVRDSVASLLPSGIPPSVRQKVQEAIEICIAQVLSAVASIKAVGEVVATNVNRVTRNGNEYLLQTQNGKIITLRDCKMVRILLMFLSNPNCSLSIEQIEATELMGHHKLPPKHKDMVDHKSEMTKDVADHYEFDKAEPSGGKRRSSWSDPRRGETDLVIQELRLCIAQYGRDLKRAKSNGDEIETERISKGHAALRDKLDELYRERGSHSRPEKTKTEIDKIRRIQMAISHFIELIARKDGALAEFLDGAICRNGHFEFYCDPTVKFEVCDSILAAINRNRTANRAESQVPVTDEG